jgi:hypothetical protein
MSRSTAWYLASAVLSVASIMCTITANCASKHERGAVTWDRAVEEELKVKDGSGTLSD